MFKKIISICVLLLCGACTFENKDLTRVEEEVIGNHGEVNTLGMDPYPSIEVDYNFYEMSSTLIYGQVYNLIVDAHAYVDKSFRVEGEFQTSTRNDGKTLYYLVINDATGCCPQGLELQFQEGIQKPSVGDVISVDALAQVYQYGESEYVYLDVTSMLVIEN